MKWPLRNGGATYLRNVTDTVQTVQTVQYSDSQCEQQQYWHERRRCSWLHAGLYCIAPRPFTPFVFYLTNKVGPGIFSEVVFVLRNSEIKKSFLSFILYI